jgi:hypothetical protein
MANKDDRRTPARVERKAQKRSEIAAALKGGEDAREDLARGQSHDQVTPDMQDARDQLGKGTDS